MLEKFEDSKIKNANSIVGGLYPELGIVPPSLHIITDETDGL